MQRESVAMPERERMKVLAIAGPGPNVVKIGLLLREMRWREDLIADSRVSAAAC